MTELVINGVATRKASKVIEALYEISFSKSTASDACKLDKSVVVLSEENDKCHVRKSSSIPLSINDDLETCSSELFLNFYNTY